MELEGAGSTVGLGAILILGVPGFAETAGIGLKLAKGKGVTEGMALKEGRGASDARGLICDKLRLITPRPA